MKNLVLKSYCKCLAFLAVAFASLVSFGDGEASAPDITHATTIVTQSQTAMTDILDAVAPAVAGIVVAGLVIWAGIAIVGVLKRGFSAGKGR